uniref:Unconventional prefoldin RPB5 interactor n=1 Tax=Esox lucius TaxID=8010 RepID=C1BYR4_ESOLU|nr:Unconventional prefoldin RPB5 interactor [Esox lucius]
MAERNKRNVEAPQGVGRLRVEHEKVVKGCEDQIQHWKNVKGDYEVLEDRLKTLPDKVSYDIMVCSTPCFARSYVRDVVMISFCCVCVCVNDRGICGSPFDHFIFSVRK